MKMVLVLNLVAVGGRVFKCAVGKYFTLFRAHERVQVANHMSNVSEKPLPHASKA